MSQPGFTLLPEPSVLGSYPAERLEVELGSHHRKMPQIQYSETGIWGVDHYLRGKKPDAEVPATAVEYVGKLSGVVPQPIDDSTIIIQAYLTEEDLLSPPLGCHLRGRILRSRFPPCQGSATDSMADDAAKRFA